MSLLRLAVTGLLLASVMQMFAVISFFSGLYGSAMRDGFFPTSVAKGFLFPVLLQIGAASLGVFIPSLLAYLAVAGQWRRLFKVLIASAFVLWIYLLWRAPLFWQAYRMDMPLNENSALIWYQIVGFPFIAAMLSILALAGGSFVAFSRYKSPIEPTP